MKSKPTYAPLTPDPTGRLHLLVGHDAGGAPLLRLAQALPAGAEVRILYAPGTEDFSEPLRSCSETQLLVFASVEDLITALDHPLADCVMGARLYVAGPESFIGLVVRADAKYNLSPDAVQREHAGSAARRVYCIHCRTFNEDVTTNVACCGGCGRHLFVRDHYSRRLAAYAGVMVDAEAPREVPPIMEAFP
jgi:hypothetical protein